jgi:hypothetical protein
MNAPVIRTDFTDEAAWGRVGEEPGCRWARTRQTPGSSPIPGTPVPLPSECSRTCRRPCRRSCRLAGPLRACHMDFEDFAGDGAGVFERMTD